MSEWCSDERVLFPSHAMRHAEKMSSDVTSVAALQRQQRGYFLTSESS